MGASKYQEITKRLNERKAQLNLFGEAKWEKISEQYENKYAELVRAFFRELVESDIRVRVMFRQNAQRPEGLSAEQVDNEFFLLYYQFIKHRFGFHHITPSKDRTRLRLYFDQFPHTGEKVAAFKGYLMGLQRNPGIAAAGVTIALEDIAEVRSHEHVLLQCLDIIHKM